MGSEKAGASGGLGAEVVGFTMGGSGLTKVPMR